MQSRILVGALALFASLAVGSAVTGSTVKPVVKWAIVNLSEATSIAGAFAMGPVIFVHDDAKMATGEPCTRVHRFVAGKGPAEEIVAFHCKPRWGKAPEQFTTAMVGDSSGTRVITEYQFAGDTEAHGVPVKRVP